MADEDLEVESRHAILNKILQFDVPESDEFDKEISTPIVEPDINTKLEDLVNQESYLLFEALGFKAENLKQLHESNFDSASPIYHQFREKVKNLSVTNVTAERNIRLISDFILKNHKEDKTK